jgi:Ca2+-binding EF-hand superfamily protein
VLSTSFVLKREPNEAKKRMEMAFDIYDVNGDPRVMRIEMEKLIGSIYEMNNLSNLQAINQAQSMLGQLDKEQSGSVINTGVVKFYTYSTAMYLY